MFLVLHRKWVFTSLLVVFFAVTMVSFFRRSDVIHVSAIERKPGELVFIDAGHGGVDGGAVSADGIAESGINLQIARKAYELLLFLGKNTRLTRVDENGLYDADSVTIRQKKVADTRNRVALINQFQNAVLISVHQNMLPSSPHTHGAQVFFNTGAGAETLALLMQDTLNLSINRDNPKTAKAIANDIYIMRHVNCPAVLVECGFLSNHSEAALLQVDAYQRKIAAAIVCGYLSNKG